MTRIAFGRNEHGAPTFEVTDDSYGAIGSLLTSDVQNVPPWSLDLLARVEDVRAGRSAEESWQGNSWGVRITPRGLYLQDLYSDWSENYPLDAAHDVMIKYWMFLTAGSPNEATAEVNEWEAKAGRAHPCRPHL
ncbi:hypothetical protein OG417_21890 [Actinoallomurus sp. NBC_01490]|jgi:hypothetical protein|uniref:hypothetical protein n=1 Tax=Actinoallomurus sp. NBC_01490 TaxID=2903557 RepID=UPI002E342CB5|nr:hypothetical protein [Actinoallomurus sp. NBC_01490]